MDKRTFLKVTAISSTALIVSPFSACNSPSEGGEAQKEKSAAAGAAAFTLPALGYGFEALEPNIDAQTMGIHHGKHHAGYVKKLNKALAGSKYENMSLEDIMANVTENDTAVRNNGGGHFNHSLFWKVLGPNGGGQPEGKLAEAINSTFDSYDGFQDQFSAAAKGVFGSGWAWLCVGADHKLFITSTPNQDNPMMKQIAEQPGTPILGIDVWEHAYYLKYQNRRGDYIGNFYNVINWKQVAENYDKLG